MSAAAKREAAQPGVAADGLVARLRLALAPAAEHRYVGQTAVETATFNGYQLVFDPSATAAAYAGIQNPGPEECDCWFCRNWVAARDEVVRPEIRAWLRRFGVPSNGEIEVWEVPGITKSHAYGGWYMVVGHIESKPESPEHEFDLHGWRLSFSAGSSYAVQAFADLAVFEIHFFTDVGLFLDEDLT